MESIKNLYSEYKDSNVFLYFYILIILTLFVFFIIKIVNRILDKLNNRYYKLEKKYYQLKYKKENNFREPKRENNFREPKRENNFRDHYKINKKNKENILIESPTLDNSRKLPNRKMSKFFR